MPIPLQSLNTLGLAAWTDELVRVTGSTQLPAISQAIANKDRFILGGVSNLVLQSNQDAPLALVCLQSSLKGIVRLPAREGFSRLRCASGENWHDFVMWTLAHGLGGLENLALIPGTVGAAPIQNIGAYGVEVGERIEAVHAWDFERHDHVVFPTESCQFGYRHSLFKEISFQGPWNRPRFFITAVDFALAPATKTQPILSYKGITQRLAELGVTEPPLPMQVAHAVISLRKEKLPDPNEIGNVGSFFKNPVVSEEFAKALASQNPGLPVFHQNNQTKLSAGWLIESAGMKGVQRGEAAVSADHALVLTNLGAATARDVLGLAHEIQEAVMARFGLWLEPEPQIIPPV